MSRVKTGAEKTHDRLIAAAIEVFASAGVVGATTREIARVAGVSEVTLFRHFQTKEHLLSAVVQQITALQSEALSHQAEWTQDLYQDLLHYARLYNDTLEKHEALVRMFIGEAQRHPEEAVRVLQQSALPLREKLVNYLQSNVERGQVRSQVDLALAVDAFTGMLLAGMLRRHIAPGQRGYSRDRYLEGCVEILVRGIGCGEETKNGAVL